MQFEAQVEGSLRTVVEREATAVARGVRTAIRRQTDESKERARRVVAAGLTSRSHRRVANTIRSHLYLNQANPAGTVVSTWGYFEDSRFVDILAGHETGLTIYPRRRRRMFIPFVRNGRRRYQRGVQRQNLEFRDTRSGTLVLEVTARGRQTIIGQLVTRVQLPKRLDFRRVEDDANKGLVEKALVEIERTSRRPGGIGAAGLG